MKSLKIPKWKSENTKMTGCWPSYVIVYDRTRKLLPYNTGDCLIEVSVWEGMTVY
jgi:hypothetical protein